MLDFLKSDEDAIVLLKSDHDKVKDLFDQFEKAETLEQKRQIALDAINELRVHAIIEEQIFYPSMRRKSVDKDLMNEADEEHHVAKLIIGELATMDGTEEHFDAKFKVLAENIRHHIKEEENELFPKCRATDTDFVALGKKLQSKKQDLLTNGIPVNAEELLMAENGVHDSSAEAALKAA